MWYWDLGFEKSNKYFDLSIDASIDLARRYPNLAFAQARLRSIPESENEKPMSIKLRPIMENGKLSYVIDLTLFPQERNQI